MRFFAPRPDEDFLLLDFFAPLPADFAPRALFDFALLFTAPRLLLELFTALDFFAAFFGADFALRFFAPEDLLDFRLEDFAPPRADEDFLLAAKAVPAFAATFLAPARATRFAVPAASRTASFAVATFSGFDAALPAIAPINPPTTVPTGPATLPMTAPAAAPAVVREMDGISILSESELADD